MTPWPWRIRGSIICWISYRRWGCGWLRWRWTTRGSGPRRCAVRCGRGPGRWCAVRGGRVRWAAPSRRSGGRLCWRCWARIRRSWSSRTITTRRSRGPLRTHWRRAGSRGGLRCGPCRSIWGSICGGRRSPVTRPRWPGTRGGCCSPRGGSVTYCRRPWSGPCPMPGRGRWSGVRRLCIPSAARL